MHIQDINGSDGPYWAAYQAYRRRENVLDDPAYVPFWFLERLARERVSAARVALEYFGTVNADEAFKALRELEDQLGAAGMYEDREQIVLGLLGAQEIETARENAGYSL